MKILRRIWDGWKSFANKLGKIQTSILLTILFFVIIPLFSFIRLKDPLRKKLGADSYWEEYKGKQADFDHFQKMF